MTTDRPAAAPSVAVPNPVRAVTRRRDRRDRRRDGSPGLPVVRGRVPSLDGLRSRVVRVAIRRRANRSRAGLRYRRRADSRRVDRVRRHSGRERGLPIRPAG